MFDAWVDSIQCVAAIKIKNENYRLVQFCLNRKIYMSMVKVKELPKIRLSKYSS